MDIAADFDFSIWRLPNTVPEKLAVYLVDPDAVDE
jgi:hypothetical protein